ncbi:hypothetical protein D3C73_974730 [compost metagenome]
MILWVFTGDCGDFRRQQTHNHAVFIGRPRFAVETQEGCPSALFATKAQAAIVQAIDKPFEAHWHFHQFTAQRGDHAVNHCTGNQRFAHRHIGAPLWTMLEQVVDGHRQIMVRVHQALRRNNAVAVVIRVVGERQIELVTQRQQTTHRRH